MKYFAILKDSLREALDSKVLYVLLALSTLVIGFVALLSFKPLSAEKTMQQFIQARIQQALNSHKPEKTLAGEHGRGRIGMRPMQFRLEKTHLLRGEPDAPESDYELTLIRINGDNHPQAVMHQDHGPAHPDPEMKQLDKEAVQPDPGKKPPVKEAPSDILKAVRDIFQEAEQLGFIKIGSIEFSDGPADGKLKPIRVTVLGTPNTHRIWATEMSVATFPMEVFSLPLGFLIYNLASIVLSFGAWVGVLAGVVITSFFIPNMLRKGTVDLLLVKPINRWTLLVYKYIGGLTFIFLSTSYAIGGLWLVLGIRSGLWANGALIMIFTITFFFAILYAVSTFVGVITRSTVTSIMVTIGVWFALYVIGGVYSFVTIIDRTEKEMEKAGHAKAAEDRWGDGYTAMAVRTLHFVTPRTSDLHSLNDMLVFTDFMTGNLRDMSKFDTSDVNWLESLIVSTLWIGIFLGLAAIWFTFKDY
jgi:ABC-type transport system involved in multi-copper enzyme maturation permease subunit